VYAVSQVVRFRKVCAWCLGTTLCTAAMVVAGRGVIASEARRVVEGKR
jgi:hypothetical protein